MRKALSTEDKLFTREDASFLSGMLTPGMRAVAIRVQEVSGVGGFIMPGDHVDVILSLKLKIDRKTQDSGEPFAEFTSETIVRNVRVMGIDQAFNDFEENVVKASSVTLEVSSKQAEIIALADSRGELSLMLRSLVPGSDPEIYGFTSDLETLYSLGGGYPPATVTEQQLAAAAAAEAAAAEAAAKEATKAEATEAAEAAASAPVEEARGVTIYRSTSSTKQIISQ